ncbi:MAG: TetR family transcriptional regulator [Microlunatus sp.]|nr:TetR family transcriptional regulator [Microlunatus sp.]MDN5770849.1 TetR family transcriptional regulator [Microlunatus sp.]
MSEASTGRAADHQPAKLTRRDRYAQQTRRDLLSAALDCFSTQGYVATSLTDIGRRAAVTRGAVYHHFDNKQALFEAVLLDQLATSVASLRAATTGDDAPERATTALNAFLDLCTREPFRTVVLEQGPIALGWHRWRELDQAHTLLVITEHLRALAKAGVIAIEVTEVLTRLFYACLHEAGDLVAHAPVDQRDDIRQQAVDIVLRFLAGLTPGSEADPH